MHHSRQTILKISRSMKGNVPWNKGKRMSLAQKRKISFSKIGCTAWNKGKKMSKKFCDIQHQVQGGENHPMYGKHHSEETRRKMREAALNRVTPNFNPIACQRIDEYGHKYGYHFQHALNGGEVHIIGYSVDGYDKGKNVVIEYYEKKHLRMKKQDARRKRRIIEHLGCKFIELREE